MDPHSLAKNLLRLKTLWALYIFILLGSVCMSTALVFVPVRALEFGASGAALGVVVGAFPLAGVVLSYPTGALADLFGRPRLLLVSALTMLTAAASYTLAFSVLPLVVGHLLVGLFDVLFWISATAYVADLAPAGSEAQAQSIGSACFAIGMIVGTASSGTIAALFGVRMVFPLLLVLAGLLLVIAVRVGQGRHSAVQWQDAWEAVRRSYGHGVKQLLTNAGVRRACLLYVPGSWSWLNLGRSFYVVYLQSLGVTPALIGLLATARGIAGIVGRLAFPFVGRRIGTAGAVILATTVGGLALAATPSLTAIPVLAVIGLLGEGLEAMKDPGTIVGVASATSARDRALGFANINQVWAMAALSGSVALGAVADSISVPATFIVGPAAAIVCVLLVAVLTRTSSGSGGRMQE